MKQTILFVFPILLVMQYGETNGNPLQDQTQQLDRDDPLRESRLIDKDWGFHHSWTLPTFSLPSVTSLFGDDAETKLKKRIEALEKSQREILELLKKISEAGKSKACGHRHEDSKSKNGKPIGQDSSSSQSSTVHPAADRVTIDASTINQSGTSVEVSTRPTNRDEKRTSASSIENEELEKPAPTREVEASTSVPLPSVPPKDAAAGVNETSDNAQLASADGDEEKIDQLGNDSENVVTESTLGSSAVNEPTQGGTAAVVAFVPSGDESSRTAGTSEKTEEP